MIDFNGLQKLFPKETVRPVLAPPFLATFGGETYTAASDGRVLIAERGAVGLYQPAPESTAESIVRLWNNAPRTNAIALQVEDLKQFLGVDPSLAPHVCATCGDSGEVTCAECDGDGGEECECDACGHTHDALCKACKGEGAVTCPDCRTPRSQFSTDPVRIGIATFNRHVLSPWVRWLPNGPATWTQDNAAHAAMLRGDGWCAFLMPLRWEDGDERFWRAPVFQPLAGAVAEG